MKDDINNTFQEKSEIKVNVKYIINNKKEEEGKMNLINFNIEDGIISYKDIISSFFFFLKKLYESHSEEEIENEETLDEEFFYINQSNINYEYIRYFNSEGFILLEENDFIFLDDKLNLNNIIIMIKANIISEEKMKIKKKYDKIDREIDYIYDLITKEEKIDLPPPAPLNLVVLTANPLMNDDKELRTMNDFNIIASKIYKAFDENDFLKYTEFNHLTINTLKDVLSNENKRPVILHLICKSTYIIPKNEVKLEKDSDNYINLIFEEDNKYYNLEFVDKIKLQKKIFDELDEKSKENIKKITLIISTPLAEDVYNLFKDFGFKNILVQPTTLADVNFIADFNYAFYQELILHTHLEIPINEIYDLALNIDISEKNQPTFCCCFHKHKKDCYFLNNIIHPENPDLNNNELYNNNKNFDNIEDIKKLIPHFYHLYPDCPGNIDCKTYYKSKFDSKILLENQSPIVSFCFHWERCCRKFKWLLEDKNEKKKYEVYSSKNEERKCYNICCCDPNFEKHNINFVFIKDFDDKVNNKKIRFKHCEITNEKNEKKIIPNYENMLLFVGKNKIIFDVIKFISSNENNIKNICIYGDNIENLKKLGSAIIEYYNEISHFHKVNKNYNIEEFKEGINLRDKNFVEINLSHDFEEEINSNNNINDRIYFIYVHDNTSVDKIKIEKNKIIWFSEELIELNINEIELNKEPILKKPKHYFNNGVNIGPVNISPNEYIKFQNESNVRNVWRRIEKPV